MDRIAIVVACQTTRNNSWKDFRVHVDNVSNVIFVSFVVFVVKLYLTTRTNNKKVSWLGPMVVV